MYNTIEVMKMEIQNIQIKFERCTLFQRKDMEGLHHIKSLPWLSVVQSMEGSYDIKIDQGPLCKTGEGGFFIAASQVTQDIMHHSNAQTRMMHDRWIFLDIVINKKHRIDHLFDFPTILPESEREEMNALFNELFAKQDDLCERMSVYYRIVKVLLRIGIPKKMVENDDLLKVINFLHHNYMRQIEVSELAAVARMSESNLYVCFRNQFGTSPIAYLNHYRLTLASDMLKQTERPIATIAEQVGFTDPLYFSKLFHKTFQVSPRQYRRDAAY